MKKTFLFSISLLALTLVSLTNPPGTLVGRWQQKGRGGPALVVFRADNRYAIFVNGKTFVSGKYPVRQDTFALSDAACNAAYYGTYKLGVFAQDSVRFTTIAGFTTIADTCQGRNDDLPNFTAGRVKVVKP
jgi:hypothetical protein